MPKKIRKRVKRGSLNRDQILDQAMQIIEDEGFHTLTMQRLAEKVGAGVMSLYTHIRGKEDLVHALADRVLGEVPSKVDPEGEWRTQLEEHFRGFRAAMLANPSFGRVLSSQGVTSSNVFEILTRYLSLLRESGFTETAAVRGYYTLLVYTLGSVSWEGARLKDGSTSEYEQSWRDALAKLPPSQASVLGTLENTLITVIGTEQFEYGLKLILDSLENELA